MDLTKVLVAAVAIAIAYLSLQMVRPLTPGALTAGNTMDIPYSWNIKSHGTPLAVVTPSAPKYLRVTSFDVYEEGKWVRRGGDFNARVGGGESYVVAITPFAVMLYPSFPVPQPIPGDAPIVKGGTRHGDTFTFNGFKTTVQVKYGDPFPYQTYMGLYVPVQMILGEPKHWSTARVQALAQKLLEAFKDRTLYDLLNYMTNWLRRDYKYALVYQGTPGKDPVDWFLFQSKTGMCVHFASAATVLLNDMGIKARVVYGFAVSYVRGSERVFVTPTHAWVEVWVPNYGWVPWDPSPPAAIEYQQVTSNRNVIGGEGGIQPPTPPEAGGGAKGGGGGVNINLGAITSALIPVAAGVSLVIALFGSEIKAWLTSWPLAFRGCVEKRLKVKGLTLRELARLTGIRELEEIQKLYLKTGKWSRKGLIKAIKWCLRAALGRGVAPASAGD